ncbi:MAG: sulfotransferase [Cyanobacteria bacterium J06641_5]
MVLPNFLIVGAQKAGTTWLAKNLEKHPDVFMPAQEVDFFVRPNARQKNIVKDINWYQNFFKDVDGQAAIGEKSPSYLYLPEAHQKIHEALPSVKLIAVLRDPVVRAISHARHLMRLARFGGEISPLMSVDDVIFKSGMSQNIISWGYYAEQLEPYFKRFDPSQMLVIINEEDIVKNSGKVLREVFEFLAVDPEFQCLDSDKVVHDGSLSRIGVLMGAVLPESLMQKVAVKRAVRKFDRGMLGKQFNLSAKQETLEQLYGMYEQKNEKLFELLGRRWSSWSMDASFPAG